MSLSWENTCRKCGREFDAWGPERMCYTCTEYKKVKELLPNQVLKVTDTGGYCTAYMFAKDLAPVGDLDVVTNDPEFKLVLEYDEIKALENHLGHKINFE